MRYGNLIGHPLKGVGTGEPPSSYGAVERSINSVVPFWNRGRGLFEAPVSVGNENIEAAGQSGAEISSGRVSRTRVRGPRRRGNGFAEQVAGNIQKGETPTLLRERLEARFDENLDGLFARINLDTNRRVAKVDLMASPNRASDDGETCS